MSYYRQGHLFENLEEGGYVSAARTDKCWVLTDEVGARELWFENPGHAGYTVVLPTGEELEFLRSL